MNSVIWSPEAKRTFESVIQYLEENWSRKEAVNFIERVYDVVILISKHPQIFIYLPKHRAYRCVVVKRISLLYRIKKSNRIINLLG